MTLFDVFEQLQTLDQAAFSLLRDTGFQSDGGLGDSVCPLPDGAEDAFLRGQAEELLGSLAWVHAVLRYLERPLQGEYTLEQFPGGRYGYFDKDGNRCRLAKNMFPYIQHFCDLFSPIKKNKGCDKMQK